MDLHAEHARLSGAISVPGSKSHTIRACILAALAEGRSVISNPLPSADCVSACRAIAEIGAKVTRQKDDAVWRIDSAGKRAHLPDNVVDAGNSGSTLYFLAPIAATFPGWSVFTGDESIRSRPVRHVSDALTQLGAETHITRPGFDAPPLLIRGAIHAGRVVTDGRLSQYVSGMMMAATRLDGTLEIELTDPKELPYLTMTRQWLESLGVPVEISADFRHIRVTGPRRFAGFERTIPSDWEAVAFPLVAALITDSDITVEYIDGSGSQGDDAIVGILQSVGAHIEWDRAAERLRVRGGNRLCTPENGLCVNASGFPDMVPALSVAACFIEGDTIIEDIGVCRRKETDRIDVMQTELAKIGANVESGADSLTIHGHSPLLSDGRRNPAFTLRGGVTVESYADHRVAMSLAVLGLALDGGLTVSGAECCSVSFPCFAEAMNGIGAGYR